MKTYSEKLKDPRWQRKRLEIMQRDDFRCVHCCSESEMLSVHHRYYIAGRMPWEYPNWSLKTLCKVCHQASHEMTERRDEGSMIPNEDSFETIMDFLGAGVDIDEWKAWDMCGELSLLVKKIGRDEAFSMVQSYIKTLANNSES